MSKHYRVHTVFLLYGKKLFDVHDPSDFRQAGVFGPFGTRKDAEMAVMRAMDRGAVEAKIEPCDIDP